MGLKMKGKDAASLTAALIRNKDPLADLLACMHAMRQKASPMSIVQARPCTQHGSLLTFCTD